MHRDNRKYIAKSEKYKGVSKVYQDNEYKWLAKSTINYTNCISLQKQNVRQH